jgi:hypothetical protein
VRARLVLASLVAVALGASAFAQEMGKKEDSAAEREKLEKDMAAEAKRFLAAVKVSAKDAVRIAQAKQPGLVVALRAEQDVRKDKGGKDEKVDCFEVTIVKDVKDPNAPKAPETNKEPPKEAPSVFVVLVDAEGKATVKPAMDDATRESQYAVKRLTTTNATVSIPAAIDKLAGHEKAQIVSVLLEDRDQRKDKKTEAYLVYALVGENIAWYVIDATTGEVERKKS